MSTMRRKVLKAGSIFALKRCENYNNSLSSVNLNLVLVRIQLGLPIFMDSSHLSLT